MAVPLAALARIPSANRLPNRCVRAYVVERYYGTDVAKSTAYGMEYQGQGWMNPGSNAVYAEVHAPAAGHSACPVCQMEVDPATALKSFYKGTAYYFCSQSHKELFDQSPEKFVDVAVGRRKGREV